MHFQAVKAQKMEVDFAGKTFSITDGQTGEILTVVVFVAILPYSQYIYAEGIGLTWDCIDFDKGIISVKKQLVQTRQTGAEYTFGSLKNGKTRVIMPAQFVIQILKRHRIRQAEMRLAAGELWNEGKFPQPGVHSPGRQSPFSAYSMEGIPETAGKGWPGTSSCA